MSTPDANDSQQEVASRDDAIGLTLSGGGFRATLFHLGVIRFLYEERRLHKVEHICSVSGGSILAAHLVLNWRRYTNYENEQEFNNVVRELIAFIQVDVRGRVVRPWLFSMGALWFPRIVWRDRWHRVNLLQREYDRLYRSQRLRHLAEDDSPQLHILATSLTTGQLVAFGNNRMQFLTDPADKQESPRGYSVPANDVPVSLAVAASSAFPPMFPPVRISYRTFGIHRDLLNHSHCLTDGGVFDNLGIRGMLWLLEKDTRLGAVIVSDAQRSLSREYRNQYLWGFSRTSRCVDLMMNRVSVFEREAGLSDVTQRGSRLLRCQLVEMVDSEREYAPAPAIQSAAHSARTDLDDFSDDEVDAVVHHGYAVARCAAETDTDGFGCTPWSEERKVWTPARPNRPEKPNEVPYAVERIDRRRIGLFRAGHWATWALVGLIALYASIIILPFAIIRYQRDRARDAENKVNELEVALDRGMKKATLLRMLGEVIMTSSPEEQKARWEQWEQYKKELSRDPEFVQLLSNERDLLTLVRAAPRDKDTLKRLRAFAVQMRRQLSEDTYVNGYFRALDLNSTQYYRELGEIIDSISDDKRLTLSVMRNSRARFWRLYWGELALIDREDFQTNLEGFANALWDLEQKATGPILREDAPIQLAWKNELRKWKNELNSFLTPSHQ
jgi:predicted acylesterase/phospholipase RssA